jgi:hypothetical protein
MSRPVSTKCSTLRFNNDQTHSLSGTRFLHLLHLGPDKQARVTDSLTKFQNLCHLETKCFACAQINAMSGQALYKWVFVEVAIHVK